MSRILEIIETPTSFRSGIHYHRTLVPLKSLRSRGHSTREVAIGQSIPDEFMEYPSVVKFGRIYPEWSKPIELMKAYQKQGKRCIYDIDDDFWYVDPSNPSSGVSNVFKDMYEGLMKQADAITTPSPVLAKKMRKLVGKKKPIYICNNGIDTEDYVERPHKNEQLVVGYMGASSHWKDLKIVLPAIKKLQENYDFLFVIQGLTSVPLESDIYESRKALQLGLLPEKKEYLKEVCAIGDMLESINLMHIPFYTPEVHPYILSRANFDIGIAPLEDTEFNNSKSCIKFYEYAAVGTPTLASDVLPYKTEVKYLAKNTTEDWYKKLEKLIVDDKFREKLAKDQQKWVLENRSLANVALEWEQACQKEGGLEVLNQKKSLLKRLLKK